MITHQKLASLIAKLEGKKSQVKIGDIREIIKILITIEAEAMEVGDEILVSEGMKMAEPSWPTYFHPLRSWQNVAKAEEEKMRYLCVAPDGSLEIWKAETERWNWLVFGLGTSVEIDLLREPNDADIRHWGREILEEWVE